MEHKNIIAILDGMMFIVFFRHKFAIDADDNVPEGKQLFIQQDSHGRAGMPGVVFGIDLDHSFGSITSSSSGISIPISFSLSGVGMPLEVHPRRR